MRNLSVVINILLCGSSVVCAMDNALIITKTDKKSLMVQNNYGGVAQARAAELFCLPQDHNQKVVLRRPDSTAQLKYPKIVVVGIFGIGTVLGTISVCASNVPLGLAAGAVGAWGVAAVFSHLNMTCDAQSGDQRAQLGDVIVSGNIQSEVVITMSDRGEEESV